TFASGSLLIAVSPEATQNVIDALSSERIPAARIGTFVDKEKGMAIKKEEGSFPLPVYHQDELSKIFG
ncbi:MAG: AIR synthase, partial [Deltaproteobacteria bacterium]|nr:AIR synthase [Deltaproteobacteria bacterium]MBW2043766.1 AIR synthase [Deltaproteobacteria bacterium]